MEFTESAVAWVSGLPLCIIAAVLCIIGLFIGFSMAFRPAQAIEMQKNFYEKINWRMEPISMEKEIANTRIMGLFAAVFSLLALYLILFSGLFCS